MHMAVLFFPRKISNRRRDAAHELRGHARPIINAYSDTIGPVSERDCGDPSCGARTIVLIMHPRRTTEAVKIDKPLEQVTQSDLTKAVAPLVARAGLSELRPKPK